MDYERSLARKLNKNPKMFRSFTGQKKSVILDDVVSDSQGHEECICAHLYTPLSLCHLNKA